MDRKDISLFLYTVKDMNQARTLFNELLGVEPYMDKPYYVGYTVGEKEIGLVPHQRGEQDTGPVGFWKVEDIRKSLQSLLEAGGETRQEVRDEGGGKLTALVREIGGSLVGLMQMP